MSADDAERALHAAYTALYYLLHDKVELCYIHAQKAIVAEHQDMVRRTCSNSRARIRWAQEMAYLDVYGD